MLIALLAVGTMKLIQHALHKSIMRTDTVWSRALLLTAILAAVLVARAHSQSSARKSPAGPPSVRSIRLLPETLRGGGPAGIGVVTLTRPALAGGCPVRITTSDASTVHVPARLLIPAGRTAAPFRIETTRVDTPCSPTVRAEAGGVEKAADVTVVRAKVTLAEFSPDTVVGGSEARGFIYLDGPAPSDLTADVVAKDGDNPIFTHTYRFEPGESRLAFLLPTEPVKTARHFKVAVTLDHAATTVSLTVSPR